MSQSLSPQRALTIESVRQAIVDSEGVETSRGDIEAETGLSTDTVQRSIRWLRDAGELRHTRVDGQTHVFEPTEVFGRE